MVKTGNSIHFVRRSMQVPAAGSLQPIRQKVQAAVIVAALFTVLACTVEPTAPSAPNVTNSADLAVVKSIRIAPDITSIKRAETLSFTVEVELGAGVPPSGPVPLWSSSNSSVVSVSSTGVATAVAVGDAIVHVTFHGHTAQRALRVTAP
jgi:uncharacterized protein YjdB